MTSIETPCFWHFPIFSCLNAGHARNFVNTNVQPIYGTPLPLAVLTRQASDSSSWWLKSKSILRRLKASQAGIFLFGHGVAHLPRKPLAFI